MTITRFFSVGSTCFCACALLIAATVCQPVRSENVVYADNGYPDGLLGEWDMVGTVRGQPVRYRAQGERVLQGSFLRLHMVDVEVPPRYEAEVFIGFDASAGDYVTHWLDRFGAGGARVVATGKREGERLVIIFPYAESPFRDTFTFEPKARTWSLLLEAQGRDGSWSTFAAYKLVRPVIDTSTKSGGG
jgi:hypothetical protein